MAARYEKDAAGWDALAIGPEMRDVVEAVLARGEAFAVSISPRSTTEERAFFDRRYGTQARVRYADSFQTRTSIARYRPGPRVVGELVNVAPQAAALEFTNRAVRRPAQVLARTAAYLGSS